MPPNTSHPAHFLKRFQTQGTSRPELRHLPTVRIILDPEGKAGKGDTTDLARTAEAVNALHITESVNPADYGIEVMDYIL